MLEKIFKTFPYFSKIFPYFFTLTKQLFLVTLVLYVGYHPTIRWVSHNGYHHLILVLTKLVCSYLLERFC